MPPFRFAWLALVLVPAAGQADEVPLSEAAQAVQPHWSSMLGVPSTGLTQGFRYHYTTQYLQSGTVVRNFGSNKGLELIVGESTQIQIGVPAFEERESPKSTSGGWKDESVLAKYRLASANEENGNYVVSASLGMSLPTGSPRFTSGNTVFFPTLAAGKGWGNRKFGFDIQGQFLFGLADHNNVSTGLPFTLNSGIQGHLDHLWPEVEMSYTHWNRGALSGKSQLVLTCGFTFEQPIAPGKKITFGAGYQAPTGTAYAPFTRGWISMAKLSF